MMKPGMGLAAVAVVTLMAGSAFADEAFTAGTPQVGGGLQYGIFTGDDDGDPPNPYNFGLNARGGYTLDMGLYVGAGIDYFFGETKEQTVPFAGTFESSANIWQLGLELGYDVGLSQAVVLRPKLGLAHATAVVEASGAGFSGESDESAIAITPGVQALFDLDGPFISADFRYNILSIESDSESGGTDDANVSGLLIGVGIGATF